VPQAVNASGRARQLAALQFDSGAAAGGAGTAAAAAARTAGAASASARTQQDGETRALIEDLDPQAAELERSLAILEGDAIQAVGLIHGVCLLESLGGADRRRFDSNQAWESVRERNQRSDSGMR